MDILFVMNAQNSFLAKNGSVYMGDKAETLKVRLVDYLSTYIGKILFFREVHAMQDLFFVNDKTHSIATTSDCMLHDIFKGKVADSFNHTRYDAFYDTNLDSYLKLAKATTVTLVGVETHTSVLFTTESLRNRGYGVTVIEPCCMSRDDHMHNCAISLMANFLGVRVGA
jgi:nicotinamidase-related amidase